MIKLKKSVIPALDVPSLGRAEEIVKNTCDINGIGAYKIGFELVIPFGLRKVLQTIRSITELPIIYDHQKAGTDIPATGEKFMNACKGVDAVIIFPQAGPVTELEWIRAAKKAGIRIIVGGEMTHPGYLEDEEGFLRKDAPERIYNIAADQGVTDYVVPGNRPKKIAEYRALLEKKGVRPILYSPGLIAQGGSLTEGAKAAGSNWHAIVGRAIYNADKIKEKATELVQALR